MQLNIKLLRCTFIGKRSSSQSVAIAVHIRKNAIPVDSALTGVLTLVATRPVVSWDAIPVVPPGIRHVIELEWNRKAVEFEKLATGSRQLR